MTVVNIRENPEYKDQAITYIQSKWGTRRNKRVYEDCILNSIGAKSPLPVWYLLMDSGIVIGCAGLITNDFISRMDLGPWLCALFIDKKYRGQSLGSLLISQAKEDVGKMGFDQLFLCTDHKGYYEKYGFTYISDGYHPWGESSRIYACDTAPMGVMV
ncbi:MAG: GNAT family N-acetyltransferase [Oscillospiraceae bacterium]|nr:GNAT family N-acetyltransferase [Oscillospiraceae bacterium]